MTQNLIPAGVLTDMAGIVDDSLGDVATVARTSAVLSCRITADRRDESLQGLPSWVQVRRWRLVFAAGSDIQSGDRVTVTGKGTYCVTETLEPASLNVATQTYALLFAVSGTGSVKRNPTSIAPGQTAGFSTPIASATFRNITPLLLSPVNAQSVSDTFGVDITQPAWTLMDYPAGNTARFPVQVGDIVTIGAATHPVRMVLPSVGFSIIYVDVSRSS